MKERLISIQKRDGLNDGQMAERLGIRRETWNRVRNGHTPLRRDVAVRAAGAWPELMPDLLGLAAASVTNASQTDERVA